ncbi:MAG TPA: antibiotic biosynthesis monooxygenase [Ilumatobacter sp.]|nr:antibiotic biosynthesis monooxygenase [Ilumatobacter sp.]
MSGDRRSMPTVIVARTPAPGREQEFVAWMERLAVAAQHAPGHVDSTVQPADESHPREWVVVYTFENTTYLQDWLDSPARNELVGEGSDLVVGDTREQVIALPEQPERVTAVSSFRVRSGVEQEFAALQRELDAAAAMSPGFLGVERYDPVPGVQDETVVVFAFDTRAHLDQWLEAPIRAELLAAGNEYVEGERVLNVVAGFGGWFTYGGPAAKKWKQGAVVLLALYPMTFTLTVLSMWLIPDVPWPLGLFISNVIGVMMLTWVLMPPLTRRFDHWLHR